MAQIFVSYANTDRPRVESLVRALQRHGWPVWWDRTITPGRTFDEVIEEALDASECLIVVWSRDSVRSQWVKTEAAEGARRGILVPVLVDDVTMPLEFRRIQAARLVDWDGTAAHPDFVRLVEAIEAIIGEPEPADASYAGAPSRDRARAGEAARARAEQRAKADEEARRARTEQEEARRTRAEAEAGVRAEEEARRARDEPGARGGARADAEARSARAEMEARARKEAGTAAGVPSYLTAAGWGATAALVLGVCMGGNGALDSPAVRAIVGTLAGLLTGLLLRRAEPSLGAEHILGISMIWGIALGAASFAAGNALRNLHPAPSSDHPGPAILTGALGAALGGAIAGLATGLALRWAETSLGWGQVGGIALGWTIGPAAGFALGYTVGLTAGSTYTAWFAGLLIAWTVSGGVGASVMFSQLRPRTPSAR